MINRIAAAGIVLALSASSLATPSVVGVANADDEIRVLQPYTTQSACMADGPHVVVKPTHDRRYFYCDKGDNGKWYIILTDVPPR